MTSSRSTRENHRQPPSVSGEDFEACTAHLRFPVAHRTVTRTTKLLERLLGEERRRMKAIANALAERPVLKLMYAALIRATAEWRGLT